MTEERLFCAQRSHEMCEPMLGTAPRVDAWLMVEYGGLWRRKALADNDLPQAVTAWIGASEALLSKAHGSARTQFIKQRRPPDNVLTLMIAHSGRLWRRDFDSFEAMTAFELDTNAMAEVVEPQYFVCTNGRRDRCCSKFGLPAYRKLKTLVGERAWETTHTGGHRFAPNVVVLPQGLLYGRVFEADAEQFVARVENGDLCADVLRGRSSYSPVAQVAEASVECGAELVSTSDDSATFRTGSSEVQVQVRLADQPVEFQPSCDAELETRIPLVVLDA